jgi:hypothetical protein
MVRHTGVLAAMVSCATVLLLCACSSGPSTGIDSLAVGTGYDAANHSLSGQGTNFDPQQTVYVAFSAYSPTSRGTAEMYLLRNGAPEDTSPPITVPKGDHYYSEEVTLGPSGSVMIEVSYNGKVQQATQITVG